ncbi:MAG: DUF4395 domain-containing protein [Geodermatophilaceae bacterium]|nr:DUF4395 domain-containing protein [Geodermatophilaceae bacterium]
MVSDTTPRTASPTTNANGTVLRLSAAPQVDVRGPRFNAWITSVVLAAGLLLSSGWILLFQTAVFAIAAFGLRYSPYGIVFGSLVAPRLGPVARREPQPPLRFAQLIGFGFAVVATIGYFAGVPVVGAVAAGFALAAALLNATTGFCLGCEMYLLGQRALHRLHPHQSTRRPTDARVTEGV